MNEESEINILVSDILDGNNYSHCRLCLESIKGNQFARFHDIFTYSATDECLGLHEVLTRMFGKEICDKIEGVDAICSDCLNKTLDMYSFILQYKTATNKLHRVLDNLYTTLDHNIDVNFNSNLYIMCNEEESQLIFVQNEEKPVKKHFNTILKCYSCKEHFGDIELLLQHNKHLHSLFTCKKCMYTSKNEKDVLEHRTSDNYYKCNSCPLFRCTEDSLKDHENRTHLFHICKECGKSFQGLEKLLVHEQKHVFKNECPKCGKTYMTTEFFEKHLKLCFENRIMPHQMRSRIVKTYFCDLCNKGYSTPGGLRVHQRFEHGNAKHHICKECGKKFTAPCYLKLHMVTHTKEKNFPCDLCQGRFVSKEALLYHRRRHTGEKPYSCDQCGERFVNASARVEHIKFKHIGPTLSCEICSKKFVTKNILRIHMKKHYDPTNKLYVGRADVPRNVNMKMLVSSITEE